MTPQGVPDLQGVWTNAWLTRMERAEEFTTLTVPEAEAAKFDTENGGKFKVLKDPVGQEDSEWPEVGDQLARIRGTARTSWVYDPADGKIPYTPAAQVANKARMEANETVFDNPEQRPLGERCLGITQVGPPLSNGPDLNNFQIVQTRDHVAIVGESNQSPRVIHLSGAHGPNAVRRWMGDSVGHWEGRTLVVETVNFHPAQARAPQGDSKADTRVIERFTRVSPTEIHYAFSVENPVAYSQRWRGEMILRPSRGPMYEYACHEGNYGFSNVLRGGRVAEPAPPSAEPATGGAATQ